MSRLSDLMLDAAFALREGPLRRFPRGWAHTKSGPFHAHKTIAALRDRGLIVVLTQGASTCRYAHALPRRRQSEAA